MKIIVILLVLLFASQVHAQTLALPPRPEDAYGRDDILRILTPLTREAREDSVFRWFMAGNVPAFLRTLTSVTSSAVINGRTISVTYHVTPDYLALGPDDRYLLMPMTPLLAQRIADALHCTLPTRKMVDDVYAASSLKLAPAPIPPSAAMITVPVFARHDSMVWAQRSPHFAGWPRGTLVGGTKKDVVISNRIRTGLKTGVPRPVVIYGWHQTDGTPIQPLYNGHGETYADYSHGIRLVEDAVTVNGVPSTIGAILRNDTLAVLLSDEGSIAQPRYGDPPTGVNTEPGGGGRGTGWLESFPNPFNPNSDIRYQIAEFRTVRLAVYDLLGREVAVLVNEEKAPGAYQVRFDATGMPSGVYFCRMEAGRYTATKQLLLVR
jgi:hypothetical protein